MEFHKNTNNSKSRRSIIENKYVLNEHKRTQTTPYVPMNKNI